MELIERLEKATEGSHQLDAEVAKAIGWEKRYISQEDAIGDWHAPGGAIKPLPRFTTSLDAALTLVPEGWSPSMFSWAHPALSPLNELVRVSLVVEGTGAGSDPLIRSYRVGEASTAPLALCIAALKARSET